MAVSLYTITAVTGASVSDPTNQPGQGYNIGDVLTVVGGTAFIPATLQVTDNTYNGVTGQIAAVTVTDAGLYTAPPANPVTVTTTGPGVQATFSISWSAIENEQGPTGPIGPTGPAHVGAQGIPGPTKAPVRVCINSYLTDLTNVSLQQDGVILAIGDRVLVVGQTDAIQNGIYYVSELNVYGKYTLRRTRDADLYMKVPAGLMVWVTEGENNGAIWWVMRTTVVNPTIGQDLMPFVKITDLVANPMPVGKYISAIPFLTP